MSQANEGQLVHRPVAGERPRSYKTEALVLRSRSMRETDRLVTILTPQMGKLTITVRGARKINSKLGGHLDLLNHVHLTLALGHHIDVVTGAESIESFGALKSNLEGIATGLYLMELSDALLPEAAPHSNAYALLLDAIRALNIGGSINEITRYVELRLLEDAGYMPELYRCEVCGGPITAGHHQYAPSLGGVVDETCLVPVGPILALSVNALKVLRHYHRNTVADSAKIVLTPNLHSELEHILGAALQYILEYEMGSVEFIKHLRKLRLHTRPQHIPALDEPNFPTGNRTGTKKGR